MIWRKIKIIFNVIFGQSKNPLNWIQSRMVFFWVTFWSRVSSSLPHRYYTIFCFFFFDFFFYHFICLPFVPRAIHTSNKRSTCMCGRLLVPVHDFCNCYPSSDWLFYNFQWNGTEKQWKWRSMTVKSSFFNETYLSNCNYNIINHSPIKALHFPLRQRLITHI